jgi:hypothetical protein
MKEHFILSLMRCDNNTSCGYKNVKKGYYHIGIYFFYHQKPGIQIPHHHSFPHTIPLSPHIAH